MSRPRVHKLSGGPRGGSSRPASVGGAAWWTQTRRVGLVASGWPERGLGAPEHAADEARTSRRMGFVADLVAAAQTATDEGAVLTALASALQGLGLNGYVMLLAGDQTGLVGKVLAVSAAGAAQIERVMGQPAVGARIDLADATPYLAAITSRRVARVEAPLWWARLAAPGLGRQEAQAVAHLIGLGDVVLAPIVAGGDVLGVLTVWAPSLSAADAALAEILGRVAGSALAGLASGVDGRRGQVGVPVLPAAA